MGLDGRFVPDPSGLARVVEPLLVKQMQSLTRRIATQARADVPVKTGNLGRTIREEPIRVSPMRVDSAVSANAPYAAAVHQGSRPHVIRARNAQALAFKMEGRMIFRKSVNHPGVKPRPFLLNAAQRVITTIGAGA